MQIKYICNRNLGPTKGVNIDFYKNVGRNFAGRCIRLPFKWRKRISDRSKSQIRLCYGMEKGSKIVIYGAGNLGNNLYTVFKKKKIFDYIFFFESISNMMSTYHF